MRHTCPLGPSILVNAAEWGSPFLWCLLDSLELLTCCSVAFLSLNLAPASFTCRHAWIEFPRPILSAFTREMSCSLWGLVQIDNLSYPSCVNLKGLTSRRQLDFQFPGMSPCGPIGTNYRADVILDQNFREDLRHWWQADGFVNGASNRLYRPYGSSDFFLWW